ncbi:MAG TPA: hypothetical protein VI078_05545 [bacterium]
MAAAAAVFLAAAALLACLSGRGDNSAWIKMTSPVERTHASNPLIGYAYTLGGEPVHKENLSFASQVLFFRGADQGQRVQFDLYYQRAFVSFVAACLFPFLDAWTALLLVNLLAWGLAALATWALIRAMGGGGRAAFLGVVLCAGGMGFVSHVGDLSAHLAAFALYYLGVYALVALEAHARDLPLRTHLALGGLLALACLQYNTGLILVLGYAAVSLRANRWWKILAGVAVALSAQYLWIAFLSVKAAGGVDPVGWLDLQATERRYLVDSLTAWASLARHPVQAVSALLGRAGEFLSFDSPPVVLLGLAAFAVAVRRGTLPRTYAVLLLAPFAAGLVYAQSASARGYLVYGVSILLYGPLALLADEWLGAQDRGRRVLTWVLIAVALPVHFAWSAAHLAGNFGPVKTYFLGADQGYGLFTRRPVIVSLTGEEPTPALFGGRGPLVMSGAFAAPNGPPLAVDGWRGGTATVNRSIFILYILALLLAADWPRRRRAVAVTAGLVSLSLVFPGSLAFGSGSLLMVERAIPIGASADAARYTVTLSEETKRSFARSRRHGDEIEIFFHGEGVTPTVLLDEEFFEITPASRANCFLVVDGERFAARLAKAKSLILRLSGNGIAGGWQRRGLPGRRLDDPGAARASALVPMLEVRLRNPDGFLTFAAF